MNGTSTLDDAVIQPLRDIGGEALVEQLFNLFLEYTPKRLAGIASGIDSRDSTEIAYWAHSLRSGAASIGAREVSRRAELLERVARAAADTEAEEHSEKLAKRYEELVAGCTELEAHLREYLRERDASAAQSA